MGFLPYIIAGIVFIGAAAGFYGKIHHDGYAQGTAETQSKWDAANVAAQKKIDQERAKEVALRESQAKEATKRLADEKKRNVILMASLEAHIKASGVAVQCPLPPSLLNDWNNGNAGPEGENKSTGTMPPASRKVTTTH